MKLVLASYFQDEHHGPGRKIGISPGKPNDVECDLKFDPFDPGELYWAYHKDKKTDPRQAGFVFVESYKQQLKDFINEVKKEADKNQVSIFEVLPFKDGDTLLSWEKKGNMSYRGLVAECLRDLGYEVEEN